MLSQNKIRGRGKPPKYATVTELFERVNAYFDQNPKRPTLTGLALFLGFSSRQSLYDYGRKDEYSYTIKRALLCIEEIYEDALIGPNPKAAIFMLKQLGWSDKAKKVVNVDTQSNTVPFLTTKTP